jgi:hypothetical protein
MDRLFAVALVCAVLSGCASAGQVNPNSTVTDKDAYFVLGISPEYTRVQIDDGYIENGVFQPSFAVKMWAVNTTFMGEPEDGFIVGKSKDGTLLGISMVQPHMSKNDLLGPLTRPCEGHTLTFTARGGKVVYIASAHYRTHFRSNGVANELEASFSSDLEGARAFLRKHYPNLAGKLEQGTYALATPGKCDPYQ